MILSILNYLFGFLGMLAVFAWLIGFFWLLMLASKESSLHFLLFFSFSPIYGPYYVITRWKKCKKPGVLFLGGLGILIFVLLGFSALQYFA